jgi:hypothetical protein
MVNSTKDCFFNLLLTKITGKSIFSAPKKVRSNTLRGIYANDEKAKEKSY